MNDPRQTVMVVDDDPSNLVVLSENLKDICRVLVAKNGIEALKRVSENDVDLILMDIVMPDMDGHETCRRLKADDAARHIPVIFLTSKSTVGDEAFGLDLGAVDYIKKPFSLPIVRARVKTHLDLKRKSDKLERLATLDGLTGVPNRRRFEEYLAVSWKIGQRNRTSLAVVMLDIDHFKLYNDSYGHQKGDECLGRVAKALEQSLKRPADMMARYGGEEFAAVLPESDAKGAVKVAQSMCKNVAALNIPHMASPTSPHVSISIGVAAVIPGAHLPSPSPLVRSADTMLYRAKESGRNRVCGDI